MEKHAPNIDHIEQNQTAGPEFMRISKYRDAYRVVFRFYVILGASTTILSLAYFAFSFVQIELSTDQRFALMFAGAGLAISIISGAFLMLRHNPNLLKSENLIIRSADVHVVRKWAVFEQKSRDLLERKGVTFNSFSPRAILLALEENDIIDEYFAREIRSALDVRNKIVHHSDTQAPARIEAAEEALTRANEILDNALQLSNVH